MAGVESGPLMKPAMKEPGCLPSSWDLIARGAAAPVSL